MRSSLIRSYISGGEVRIERDPDMTKLTDEARRLSMGSTTNGARKSSTASNSSPRHSRVETPTSRRTSAENNHDHERRLSESGLRRGAMSDVVLNDETSSLMVGTRVFVDGKHAGRIAFVGETHFAKGEVAGVHLERPLGKNNGTVGGVMYFQCEPNRGIFARLHRLTREPIMNDDEDNHFYHE